MTAHEDHPTIERIARVGAFAYITKPFTKFELKATVEIALHKHQTESDDRKHLPLATAKEP